MADLNVIGKPENKDLQMVDILTGRFDYSADILPGRKLFARYKLSPHAHAKVLSIDTSAAMAMDGVEAVCTYEDCPTLSDEMLHWGMPVAAVAAVDEATAARAALAIDIQYEVLPSVIEADEARKPGAPLSGAVPDSNVMDYELVRGDPVAGFNEANLIVESTVGWAPLWQHGHIETGTATCYWTGDQLYCQATSQNIFSFRRALSGAFNMPQHHVHCVSHGSGTGHGDKHYSEWAVVCAVLAKKAGKPVCFSLSRAEQFLTRTHQYGQKGDLVKIGCKDDGTITAIDAFITCDVGAAGRSRASGGLDNLRYTWNVDNGNFIGQAVTTNTPFSGPYRCVQHPPSLWIHNIAFDRAAEAVGLNPAEFRYKNIQPDNNAVFKDNDRPFASYFCKTMLDTVIQASDFSNKWHEPGTETLPNGKKHGIGISVNIDGHGGMSSPVGAIVNMTPDGKALICSGITRAGGGTNTAHAHIVAETLGIKWEDVETGEQGNTDIMSDGGGQGGSTRTITTGAAFYEAAMDARNQIFETAAVILGVDTSELDASDGVIFEKGNTSNSIPYADATSRTSGQIVGRGYAWPKELKHRAVAGFPIGTPCEVRGGEAAVAEIAVDEETGEIEILGIWNLVDTGKNIFYKGCENQIEGGAFEFIAEGILRHQRIDSEGVTVNANFIDGKSAMTTLDQDTSRFHAIMVESDDACGPYGCKGIGEPCVTSFSTIASALYNATGVWLEELPMDPPNVLKALGKG
jgi:xanthine dehydrogenase molybdenum-binding subunit